MIRAFCRALLPESEGATPPIRALTAVTLGLRGRRATDSVHDSELSLSDYIQIFLRRAWVLVLTALACVVLALVWTARQTPMYSSSASVLINQANASDLFDPVGTGNSLSYAERQAATEARFLTSGIVSDEAINRLGYEAYVDVREDSFADVLTVTATSADAAEAQQIAQTYAEAYVDVREQRFASERTATANQLAERLAEIDLQIAGASGEDLVRLQAFRSDVAESLDLLNLTAGLAEDSGTIIIDNAFLPQAPFTPRTNRNVALSLVLGLMAGAGLVLLLEALDRSVKSREVLESLTPGAPNLAIIPSLGKSLQRRDTLVSQSDPTGASAEAFRTLRASLQYVAVDDSARVIQVASAHSAAGKTTVAANLAITLAQAGQRVVVIDADLRRPRLHQLFGVEQVPGLTSAIIGAAPLSDCIQRLPEKGSNPFVLASGPIPPGPAELLGSAAAARAVELIRDLADYVIIDTAPVLPVADTTVLSRYVDASILVADASNTKRADVAQAFERLEQAGAPVIGTVLNKVKRRPGLLGYGYGYGYGYGGYQQDGGGAKPGLVGWFSRGGDDAKIERLHGSDVPRIKAAPRIPVGAAPRQQSNGTATPTARSFTDSAKDAPASDESVTAQHKSKLKTKQAATEPEKADEKSAGTERSSSKKKSKSKKAAAVEAAESKMTEHADSLDDELAPSFIQDSQSEQASAGTTPDPNTETGDWADDIVLNDEPV